MPLLQTVIIFLGVLLRLRLFLENRSLWLDESYRAVNLIGTTWPEYLKGALVLPAQPRAPLGFAILVKGFIQSLGSAEWVLRLCPFLSSLAAIGLFALLVRRWLDVRGQSLALALFVIGEPFVYYSVEIKQYATDVLAALILYYYFDLIRSRAFPRDRILSFGLLGAVLVWFSFPAIFVLAGLGITLSGVFVSRRDWDRLRSLTTACVLIVVSVLFMYQLILKPMVASAYIRDANGAFFMPYTQGILRWCDGWAGCFRTRFVTRLA